MKSVKKAAVLYHYPCPDGVFAALAAHLYFKALSLPVAFFPNTVYDPIRAEDLPVNELSEVYLLDFVGPSGFVSDISFKVESVTILDHHKTAFEELSGKDFVDKNVTKIIDMKRSGATIAFDYFREKLLKQPNVSVDKFVPESEFERIDKLFKYIEDADLWRWVLPNSKAFSSGLKDTNIEFNVNINSALFDQLLDLNPDHVIAHGQDTLLHKQELINQVLERSYKIGLGKGSFGQCLAVDADSIANLRSELGNQLATKSYNLKLRAIGAVVYKVPELNNYSTLKVSLRSLEEEDTTPISQTYGGGGHKNASSFMMAADEFAQWKVAD